MNQQGVYGGWAVTGSNWAERCYDSNTISRQTWGWPRQGIKSTPSIVHAVISKHGRDDVALPRAQYLLTFHKTRISFFGIRDKLCKSSLRSYSYT
jgi:hypothetical protein